MPTWTDPGWLAEVHGWIRERVDVTGPIEQPHVRPWSTVLRVPTTDGTVWFKANAPASAYEAAVISVLARERRDVAPQLLAADLETGWMLMADGGERLRDVIARERDLRRWLDVLPLYAGLQIDLAPHADELVGLGVPDCRLATLPDLAAELGDLRPDVPHIADLSARLAAYGIPETIQHDDLGDGDFFLGGRSPRILDWGDSCVSHPFLTMSVTIEGVIAWGVDDIERSEELGPYRNAYLAPFERYATHAELEVALDLALRLGWVCRILDSERGLADREPAEREQERERRQVHLRMFRTGLSE
jgi:hypothetical protein